MTRDDEHLGMLAVGHYVVAGFGALAACAPVLHLAFGILMVKGTFGTGRDAPPPALGWALIAVAAAIIVAGWTFAACVFHAGRCLARRRRYWFCFVMACIYGVLCSALGTALAVLTIIVLVRPPVKTMFGLPVAVDAARAPG